MFPKPEWKVNNFQTEQQFQAAAIIMISQCFPKLRDKVWHTKNETYIEKREFESTEAYKKRCLIEGARNKAQGMLSGVMDILVLRNGILYKIELKQPKNEFNKNKGELSESQEKIHGVWNTDCPRIPCIVAYTMSEVYEYCKYIVSNKYRIDFIGLDRILKYVNWNDVEWSGEFTEQEIIELKLQI